MEVFPLIIDKRSMKLKPFLSVY